MSKEKFVRAAYRITRKQHMWVKKQAKKCKCSEAEIIRIYIHTDMQNPVSSQ